MSNDTVGNSLAAQHAEVPDRTTLALATTDGSKFNTIRVPLIPVACWRLNDPAFAFDSSFVSPNFRAEINTLSGVVAANTGCPAALFGHCDPEGDDALNKTLGDRRAIAIYALLIRQPDSWAYLYDNPQVGDTWDAHMVQCMLGNLPDPQGNPYYPGGIDGDYGPQTTDAVKRFQNDQGLSADGKTGKDTRSKLFAAYMDWLCTPDGGASFQMQTADFLGGAGAGPGDLPKMSLQSCGKYNPIILLPNAEMSGSDRSTRHADDAPNRRVMMFFFPKGTKVDESVWPCPEVKESNAACSAAFWPDGDARRKNGDELREYKTTHDTMACRFYDRFARRSPCEVATTLRIWLQDDSRQRMPNAKYKLAICGQTILGTADDQGLLMVQAPPTATTCTLEWGEVPNTSSSETTYSYRRDLDVRRSPSDRQSRDLDNLAYLGKTQEEQQASFDVDYPDHTVSDVHDKGLPKQAQAKG